MKGPLLLGIAAVLGCSLLMKGQSKTLRQPANIGLHVPCLTLIDNHL
jgi:hypothetical protein